MVSMHIVSGGGQRFIEHIGLKNICKNIKVCNRGINCRNVKYK